MGRLSEYSSEERQCMGLPSEADANAVVLPSDDETFTAGRVGRQQHRLDDWLLRRGKERMNEVEPTEPNASPGPFAFPRDGDDEPLTCDGADVDACPMPLDFEGDNEPTVVATHPFAEVTE